MRSEAFESILLYLVGARTKRRTVHLTEARQLRALAHPLRLKLLGLLRTDGPATATTLAERVGQSVPLASYHLRQLAANGFVDEAGELARDARERWWRARHQITSWDVGEFLDSPERLAAGQALSAEVARRYAEVLQSWVAEMPTLPRDWIGMWELSDRRLELAPDELVKLRSALATVIERFVDRPRRDDTEPVIAVVELLPIPRPAS